VTGLTFAAPMPGLEPLVDFELNPVAGAEGLFTLQALDVPDRKMYLLDAGIYLPDYQPEISDAQAAMLRAAGPEEVVVFVVATHRDGVTTVNLLAPIVVNNVTSTCAQVILEDKDYSLRHELKALSPA
jgi:flagellar assembly factor FliW